MKCQWKNCESDAVRIVYRPVKGVVKDANKRRTWNEDLMVCDACQPAGQTEYPYRSFVHPDNYETHCNPGCFR